MSVGSVRLVHMTRCGLGSLHQFNVHCHFDDSHRKFVIPGLRSVYVQNGGGERERRGGGLYPPFLELYTVNTTTDSHHHHHHRH